ncbi:MAG: PKD domain-containing protein [Thermoplasmata archaeon]|nr:MAG: PKD domain-containing protein [Thermoplasmata archaeon]
MKKETGKLSNFIIVGMLVLGSFLAMAGPLATITASADAGIDQVVDVNTIVNFDGSGSFGVGDLEYTWYFRDGTITTVDSPYIAHTYSEEGIYEVGLLVKDSNGYYDLDTVQITVKNYYPVGDPGFDKVANEDQIVNFDASASSDLNNDIVSYEWDFGDGTSMTGISASNVYEDEGTYYAKLKVTDNDGAYDEDLILVTVNNVAPSADGRGNNEVDDDVTIYEDEQVTFDAFLSSDTPSDVPLLKYSWDFGDGCMGSGITSAHTYTKQGIYMAILKVTDDNEAFAMDTIMINVINSQPVADAGLDQAVNEGSSCFFDGSGSSDTQSDEPLLLYSWDFEKDGAYDDTGWYSKYSWWDNGPIENALKTEDDDGAAQQDNKKITVNNVAPLPGIFNYSTSEITIVNFSLRVTGEKYHDVQATLYEDSTQIGYMQVIRAPGNPNEQMEFIYNVEIHSENTYEAKIIYTPEDDPINGQIKGASPCWFSLYLEDGNKFTFFRSFNVNKPDEWEWTIDLSSIRKMTFDAEIYDPGMDIVTFGWDFGDSSPMVTRSYSPGGDHPTKVCDMVMHVYVLPKVYTVVLNSFDDDGAHSIYALILTNTPDSVTLDNLAPRAQAFSNRSTALEDEEFEFLGSGIDLLNDGLTYSWDFDDGHSETGQVVNHSYDDEGIYLVTLTVTDSLGAHGKDYIFVKVTNAHPIAEAGQNQVVSEDDVVKFWAFDSWDTISDLPLLSYAWDFGDGSKGCGITTDHIYTKKGVYTVTLTVQDNNGAMSKDIVNITVNNPAPYGILMVAEPNAKEDELIHFNGSAQDTASDEPLLAFNWDFGDGKISYGTNVTHSYSLPGLYEVELTITDDDLSSANKSISVMVVNVYPTGFAGATHVELYGPAMTVEFEGRGFDTFSDGSSLNYSWNLGGGDFEYSQTINMDFTATGIYDVSFEVKDVHLGSSSTIMIRIDFVLDSDGDMMTDEDEQAKGTDPFLWDSDGDDLIDYWEVYYYSTDPQLPDTDNDGMDDWEEITFIGFTDIDEDGIFNPLDWDSDGDWIRDGMDTHPMLYNDVDGTPITRDAISVSNTIGYGVSVIMYGGFSYDKPTLSDITPPVKIAGETGIYVRVQTMASPPFNAQIRIRYDKNAIPGGIAEERLRLFEWSSVENKWLIVSNSGVDLTHGFVWAKVSYFTDYGIGDIGLVDSDGDGLNNWQEINTKYTAKFVGGGLSPTYYSGPLYVKNRRIQIQIPPQNIYGNKGAVDLFGLGFKKADFAIDDTWRLTNGGYLEYAKVYVSEVYNAISAIMTFQFTGKDKYMRIDVRGFTDPFNPDTDSDGFLDGDELSKYKTNPIDTDTDDDRIRDGSDLDPLVDLHIIVHIKEILEIDRIDTWPFGIRNNGDFYAKVNIYGKWHKSPEYGGMAHGYPNYFASQDIPDNVQNIYIKIELWDADWPSADDQADISRSGKTLDLTYDVRTGMWSGEDSLNDRNGLGHASGTEDGSNNKNEGDVDIWFDIYQNDYDNDGLAYWKEVHSLGTNPKSTNGDSDGDDMADWYEVRYGFNRLDPSDAQSDSDGDHLTNLKEYQVGTDPRFFEVNLVVSLDWDASESYMDKYVSGMRKASNFLYDVTDGYLYFRCVFIYDNEENWDEADIRVYNGTAWKNDQPHWPQAKTGGFDKGGFITMPQYLNPYGFNIRYGPTRKEYYKAIVHESGHYIMHSYDEYCRWSDTEWGWVKIPSSRRPHTFMNDALLYSEASTPTTYKKTKYHITAQWEEAGMSTWESFFYNYTNRIWFDLDKNGVDDTMFLNSYTTVSGPTITVDGGFTIVKTYNT